MTIKNSLISVAASALLISAITGCSSSDSTPATTTTGIQSSVQAVDGYLYNATGKAYYLADNNTTMTAITLVNTKTTKDVATGKVTLGTSTYTLPSTTTDAVKSRIKFFQFTNAASSTTGTTFTPAAYIEGDNIDGYDVNDTLLGATTITVPASSSIASPVTQLLYHAVGSAAYFGSTTTAPTIVGDLNTSTFTAIEGNATKIATNLGLGSVNLLTADPVALASSNPTFRLVTALLKDATAATATSILAATAPTTLAATLTNVATALPAGTAKTLATSLAASAANGGFKTTDIASLNVEKSVTAGTIQTLAVPSKTGKFPINAIQVNGVNTDTLTAAGAKLQNDTVVVDVNVTATDGNISNQSFSLYIHIEGDKTTNASTDGNTSGYVTAVIPFEVNATKATTTTAIATAVSPAAIVSFEAKASNGGSVVTKTDLNASTVLGTTYNTGYITASAQKAVRIDVKAIVNALVTPSDTNLSTSAVTGLSTAALNGISSVSVYLKDVNGVTLGTSADGLNSIPLAKGTLTSGTGTLSVSEGLKLYSNTTTDFRQATVDQPNVAPSAALTLTAANLVGSGTSAMEGTGTLADPYILNNNTGYNGNLAATAIQTWETNTTFGITSEGTQAAIIADKNSTYVNTVLYNAADSTGAVPVTNIFEANTTSATLGELNSTISYKVTDEFGESNTSMIYVRINRAPYVTSNTFAAGTGGNKTMIIADYDGNGSTGASVAVAGTPALSTGSGIRILCNDNKYRFIAVGGTTTDCNISNAVGSVSSYYDANYTIAFLPTGHLELNQTIGTLSDINFTIVEINATDAFGSDLNNTVNDTNYTY